MSAIAAFDADGARIVGTVDWIPVTARVACDGWRLEVGQLAPDFDDLTPHWDGVLTQTENGSLLFVTEHGMQVREDALILRALDEDGRPTGEPRPFTPVRRRPCVFDAGLATATAALAAAADQVTAAWDRGDLAAAVRRLAAAADALRPLLPTIPATAATPATALLCNPETDR